MKIKADTKSVEIIDEVNLTSGAFNDTTLDIELSSEYQGLTTFVTFNKAKTMVIGNMIKVPTLNAGRCRIGVYAIDTDNNEIILRYSPTPAFIYVKYGSYKEGYSEDINKPTPTEAEKIYNLINEAIENGKINGNSGTKDYNQLSNKPSINGVTLIANDLDDLGIQEKLTAGNNITIDSDNNISAIVPTKASDLINDCQFITASDISSKADMAYVDEKTEILPIQTDKTVFIDGASTNSQQTVENNRKYLCGNISSLTIPATNTKFFIIKFKALNNITINTSNYECGGELVDNRILQGETWELLFDGMELLGLKLI